MARIRSIKPEFWTSEQIADCSPIARLLFIGIWSFSDDAGVHPANIKRLKMEIFPGDDITTDHVGELIDELLSAGLLAVYESAGIQYWRVTGWHHQKIDQPTYKHPDESGSVPNSPAKRRSFGEQSPSERVVFTPGEEGKGEEGKGEDDKNLMGTSIPNCPHRKIVELYNTIIASTGLATEANPELWANSDRATALQARWKEDKKRQNLEWWQGLFAYVAKSDFLMGKTDKPFKIDAGWILKRSNFIKILEGKYHG